MHSTGASGVRTAHSNGDDVAIERALVQSEFISTGIADGEEIVAKADAIAATVNVVGTGTIAVIAANQTDYLVTGTTIPTGTTDAVVGDIDDPTGHFFITLSRTAATTFSTTDTATEIGLSIGVFDIRFLDGTATALSDFQGVDAVTGSTSVVLSNTSIIEPGDTFRGSDNSEYTVLTVDHTTRTITWTPEATWSETRNIERAWLFSRTAHVTQLYEGSGLNLVPATQGSSAVFYLEDSNTPGNYWIAFNAKRQGQAAQGQGPGYIQRQLTIVVVAGTNPLNIYDTTTVDSSVPGGGYADIQAIIGLVDVGRTSVNDFITAWNANLDLDYTATLVNVGNGGNAITNVQGFTSIGNFTTGPTYSDTGGLNLQGVAATTATKHTQHLSLIHIPSPRDRQKSRMPSSA